MPGRDVVEQPLVADRCGFADRRFKLLSREADGRRNGYNQKSISRVPE